MDRDPRKTGGREGMSRRHLLVGAGATLAGGAVAEAIGLLGGLAMGHQEGRLGRFKDFPARVGNTKLHFVGVDHTLATFRKSEEKIREQIREAPFVILEYFDSMTRAQAIPGANEDSVRALPMDAQRFFAAVGKVCAKEGKDVVVVNPDSAAAHALHSLLLLGVPLGALFTLVNMADKGDLKARHALLGSVAQVPTLATWLSEAGAVKALRSELEKNGHLPADTPKEHKADLLGTHIWDWRDVVTAKGIARAEQLYHKELGNGKDMLSYHGIGHAGTIEYLEHPERREAKEKLYAVHNLLGDMTLRRYRFDTGLNEWLEKDEESLNSDTSQV